MYLENLLLPRSELFFYPFPILHFYWTPRPGIGPGFQARQARVLAIKLPERTERYLELLLKLTN